MASGSVSLRGHPELSSSSSLDVVSLNRGTMLTGSVVTSSSVALIGHPELSSSSSLDETLLNKGTTPLSMIGYVVLSSLTLPDLWSTIREAPSICMSSAKRLVSIE